VVGEPISDRLVGLAVGDVAERGAIDPGQHPPVDDEVVGELGDGMIPAADGPVLRPRGAIGVGRLAIIQVGPDPVVRLPEAAVEVPEHDERHSPRCGRVDPASSGRERHEVST
jgi:hypothetical protein